MEHRHGALHGMGHGSAGDYLRRFWIVTALLIPLALTNGVVAHVLHLPLVPLAPFFQFVIATAIFAFALVFFRHAWHEIRARSFGMMTLVSLAVGAGYTFSVVATLLPSLGVQFYLEISTLVWVLLFGHYLEARSSSAAGDALQEVAKLLPKSAHVLVGSEEREVDITKLVEGDTVLIRPGEKAPADGEVIRGEANVDESHLSGESKPIGKSAGSSVVAGSIALDGALTIRLSRVGVESTVGQIQKLIAAAAMTKPREARIADRAAAALTFVAVGVALAAFLAWFLIAGATFSFAITLAITVLVIACPHALGLAIPAVTTIATALSAKNGIFIKDLSKVEKIRKADYVVFDKTGTLTEGVFGVSSVEPLDNVSVEYVLAIAASLEKYSSHVIGRAIVAYAGEQGVALLPVEGFKDVAGKGIRAQLKGKSYFVGNRALMEDAHVSLVEVEDRVAALSAGGKTPILIAEDSHALGIIALSDKVKSSSKAAVQRLHELGLKVAILTGDHAFVAHGVADELGVDEVFAEVLPKDKYVHVKALQEKGHTVAMVGDGVNDAPALTQADIGVAIGAGTDVAIEAGDVVLTRSDPSDVVRLITLSRAVYTKMLQNLAWALGYNIVAIPAAAGIFAAWGFYLRPELGALIMSISTVIVVVNAMSLRRIDLS